MHIKIHTHQLDMSDPLRTYAESHIADAIRKTFKRQAATLDIEFSDAVGGRERACKVTFFVPHGKTLVATAQDPNPYAAVDLVAEKIAREVRRYKEKRLDATRHAGRQHHAEISDVSSVVDGELEDSARELGEIDIEVDAGIDPVETGESQT